MLYFFNQVAQDPDVLLAWVKKNHAVVVDVRRKVVSHDPRWSKPALEQHFGERYLHLAHLEDDDAPRSRTLKFQLLTEEYKHIVIIPGVYPRKNMQGIEARLLELAANPKSDSGQPFIPYLELNARPKVDAPADSFTLTIAEAAQYLGISLPDFKYHKYTTGTWSHLGRVENRKLRFSPLELEPVKRERNKELA